MGDSEFLVGFGEADITPTKPVFLKGYYHERLSTSVHDPLGARAMAVSNGQKQVVLCVADLVYFIEPVVRETRRLVEQECGLPSDHLLLSCNHTHTGPDLEQETEYAEALPRLLATAVRNAVDTLAPAALRVAHGEETSQAFVRRYRMKDGSVRTNPGILNPDVDGPLGTPDYALTVLMAANNADVGGLIHYGLHCDTVGGTEISADWPYYVREQIREALGPDLAVLTPIGTAGDVNHWNVFAEVPARGFALTEQIGRTLGGAALDALKDTVPVAEGPVKGQRVSVEVDLRHPSPEELSEAQRVWDQPAPTDADFTMDRVEALRRIRVSEIGPATTLEITVLTFGDVALVGMPCELFTELGRRIKDASPFAHTFVVTLADGTLGYVGTREALEEGGYEMTSTLLASGMGERMADAAIGLLRKIRG
ncbi:MAG: hypothetical protein GY851_04430 [bacterium]|nr:hypothetical protein [bacterium]